MNDFTKKELEALRGVTYCWLEQYRDSEIEEIDKKLQSMIDNYCDHEWRKGVHLFNDVYCTKCKLHFEVNNNE